MWNWVTGHQETRRQDGLWPGKRTFSRVSGHLNGIRIMTHPGDLTGYSPGGEIMYSEAGGGWEDIRPWALCMIALGFAWPNDCGRRRLCFVSTPCESVAAGFITLGALLRRLTEPGGDDRGAHIRRLEGMASDPNGQLLVRHRVRKGRFRVLRDESGRIAFEETNRAEPSRHFLLEANALDWYVDGEPPLQALPGAALSHPGIYQALLPTPMTIRKDNLRRSDSRIVLAGRVGGRSVTERSFAAVALRHGEDSATLSDLLSIHGWQSRTVSRARYFNPRAQMDQRFDRAGPPPSLAIADGPGSFEAIVDLPEVANTSVVAVVPRTADSDQLEQLAARVEGMTQWYEPDTMLGAALPSAPGGTVITVLRRAS